MYRVEDAKGRSIEAKLLDEGIVELVIVSAWYSKTQLRLVRGINRERTYLSGRARKTLEELGGELRSVVPQEEVYRFGAFGKPY
ncbi:MAG: hypothetical protein ABIJ18_04395 [archaeon]